MAVGTITKMFGGVLVEALTDMDTYKIEFPENSNVNTKVLLMGAAMLMVKIIIQLYLIYLTFFNPFQDYMYFEKQKK